MKDSDPFWKNCGNTYTKQFAITKQGGDSLEKGDDKEWVKKWYNGQSQYWRRGNQKVFKSWVQAHKTECMKLCKKFIKLLKGRFKGDVPKDVIDRTFAVFKES
jgi:hypothetical protein